VPEAEELGLCTFFCESIFGGDGPPSGGEAQCGSREFDEEPINFEVVPVKGEKAFYLSWEVICEAVSFSIYRCEGDSCNNFELIDETIYSYYQDISYDLLWGKEYRYQVMAHYVNSDSQPTTEGKDLGDLECWHHYDSNEKFCVHLSYYDQFKTYMVTNEDYSSNTFRSEVNATFYDKFNKGYKCSASNELAEVIYCSATAGKVCISHGGKASCAQMIDCQNESS